ncbi:inorganic phosphate cotransporter [Elysia marginata]|uniref:Inorganic phosphate cotransporter n=1 Tax=Elysia marginata TaxID=1093978 RepID=A0AAV4HJY3_9GAST|nr:inorganic phosphate cotransporter [Elysia marginata]
MLKFRKPTNLISTVRNVPGASIFIHFHFLDPLIQVCNLSALTRSFVYISNACAPTVATLLPRWTPSKHNLTVVAFVYVGPTLGPMLLSILNGFLCSIPLDNGWPFIFYVAGALHAIFAVSWYFLMGEYPETHRFISEEESNYIVSRRPELAGGEKTQKKTNRPPYSTLLSSVPVLTFIFTYVCFIWVLLVTVVYVPIYLNDVHGFSAKEVGVA